MSSSREGGTSARRRISWTIILRASVAFFANPKNPMPKIPFGVFGLKQEQSMLVTRSISSFKIRTRREESFSPKTEANKSQAGISYSSKVGE